MGRAVVIVEEVVERPSRNSILKKWLRHADQEIDGYQGQDKTRVVLPTIVWGKSGDQRHIDKVFCDVKTHRHRHGE